MYGFVVNWSRSCTQRSRCMSQSVKSYRAIVKFTDRKSTHNVQVKQKNLHKKSFKLSRLKFSGKLFVSGSMYYENHQLAYKCRKLKNLEKIHLTWFHNNAVNIKLTENGGIHKIFHIIDIEKSCSLRWVFKQINISSQYGFFKFFFINFYIYLFFL